MPAYLTESYNSVGSDRSEGKLLSTNVIFHQPELTATPPRSLPHMGTGIETDAVGISILASGILIRYRTGSPYSGTGLVLASAFLFIAVPD